ncbi:MAG: hypothetical protein EOL97_16505 [Spirochaetia bacterium]|nr:hypothetical protein [Spirochaetia bacterium]
MEEHKCSKETEIALIKQNQEYINHKIEEIHKVIVGNGRLGLADKMAQIEGALRFTQVSFGILMGLISVVIGFLALFR